MSKLLVNKGAQPGHEIVISVPECVVGRHPDCQIVVDDTSVSRQHARIVKSGPKYLIEDLDSRNKTYVNDEELLPFQRRELQPGDAIRVCGTEFAFRSDAPPTTPGDIFKPEHSSLAVIVDDLGSRFEGKKFEVSSHYEGKGVKFTATAESRLRALLEVSQALGHALSLDQVLHRILDTLFTIFDQVDRGFIVLEGPKGDLEPRWVKTRRESDEMIRISRTIVKSVMESKAGLLSDDASTDQRFEMSESLANFKIRSLMCAPLIDSEGRVFGALQIDTLNQKRRFEQEDLEVLVSVAIQAGVAISNMQLQEQALEQKRMRHELQVAQEVQQSFLPQQPPALVGYEFFAYYQAFDKVGGDYYDYIPLPDGRCAIVVADVVGHGVAAALLMARLAAEIRFFLAVSQEPAEALTELNRRLASLLDLGRFITLVGVVLDPNTGEATLINAGHMAPIVRRANGSLEEPGEDEGGTPIGIFESEIYQAATFVIAPGDQVVLYTDGLNESKSASDEDFGIHRMRELISGEKQSPEQLGKGLMASIQAYSHSQDDDRCLVIFERTAAS